MAIRVAINGLGRIGRCVLRAYAEYPQDDIEIVAINTPGAIDTVAHLLKYDSTHGTFPGRVEGNESTLYFGDHTIKRFANRDPANLPWEDVGVDVVLECTGIFKKHEDASKHIKAGAKKVLISAPSSDADAMIVYGVNNDVLKPEDTVISVGSCTTNCLAPVAKVLEENIGIEQGFMTTIHAYTGDQNILDNSHKDLRRARAAAASMVPTSTGAARAIGQVLPELQGKLDGVAVRVPTPNVSMVDLCFNAKRETSVEEINSLLEKASKSKAMKGVLGYNEAELVSIDFNHDPHSSIFDATGTQVLNGNFVRVAAWYDNEWGFSCRMLDVARLAASA